MSMEFSSPVYRLLYFCELKGMKLFQGWDIMPERVVLELCGQWLRGEYGFR
jgi:hypothetical protein